MLYGDEELFENMHDEKGKRQSMAKWGEPKEKLLSGKTWQEDNQLNLFRRICTQLYHSEGAVDTRVVDSNVGLEMHSAPFYCARDKLFNAVFGNVQNDFHHWSETLDLNADSIVAALDGCHDPAKKEEPSTDKSDKETFHYKFDNSGLAPAPAVEPAFAPVPASTNLLRANRHRRHHEVYHYRLQGNP